MKLCLVQIDIPLRPSKKSRSLVWKNWSRMHLFDFTKRFKDVSDDTPRPPSSEAIKKRQKTSLTLSELSKRFNYRSMRNKARKMCIRHNSTVIKIENPEAEKPESSNAVLDNDNKA